MNPADFVNELREHCDLCRRQPKEVREDSDRDVYHVVCDVCGRYAITQEVLWRFRSGELPSDMQPYLSAVVRRHFDFFGKPETITTENYEALVSQSPDKNDVPGKVRYLLDYIAHRSSFPGDKVFLTSLVDYPICFAANKDEFEFYIQNAINAGFVEEHDSGTHVQRQVCLTTKGWEETRRIAPAPPQVSEAVAGSESSSSDVHLPKIFICYRRDDSAYPSQSIYDTLVSHFGKESVFFDVDTIPVGQDFHGILNKAVAQCNVLLAVIGDHWLNAEDEAGQRRLDNPDDFVRIEIEAALSRGISVIPVLLGRAMVPKPEDLPPTLKALSRRQATELRHGRDFRSHLERLIRDIEQAFAVHAEQLSRQNEVAISHAQDLTANEMPPVILTLTGLLKNGNREGRDTAAKALVEIGSAAVPALTQLLKDENWASRWAAAWTLGKIGSVAKVAIPALTELLKDEESLVRQDAAEALGKMGSEAKMAIPALTELLKDNDREVRYAAAKALGNISPEAKSAIPAHIELLRDKDEKDRRAASQAVDEINKEKK